MFSTPGRRSPHRPLVRLPFPSCPVATIACCIGAQPSSSINLHMCFLGGGWRLQTAITTVALHQRVIWLPQAL